MHDLQLVVRTFQRVEPAGAAMLVMDVAAERREVGGDNSACGNPDGNADQGENAFSRTHHVFSGVRWW